MNILLKQMEEEMSSIREQLSEQAETLRCVRLFFSG